MLGFICHSWNPDKVIKNSDHLRTSEKIDNNLHVRPDNVDQELRHKPTHALRHLSERHFNADIPPPETDVEFSFLDSFRSSKVLILSNVVQNLSRFPL